MKILKNNINNTTVINKSKFICYLYYVQNIDEIRQILNEIKIKEKNANHYCFGYIINNIKRFSDDGEPSSTAGIPILNILETNDLNNILAVVVRYFGGIKLGAGGLIRAYSNTVKNTINDAEIKEAIYGNEITITFKIEHIKSIDSMIKTIENKNFYNEKVTYQFQITIEETDNILEKLKPYIINYQMKKNIIIN